MRCLGRLPRPPHLLLRGLWRERRSHSRAAVGPNSDNHDILHAYISLLSDFVKHLTKFSVCWIAIAHHVPAAIMPCCPCATTARNPLIVR